jgi:uncharacterized membrane protein
MVGALCVALTSASKPCRFLYLWALHFLFLVMILSRLRGVAGGVAVSPTLAVYAVVLMVIGVRRRDNGAKMAGALTIGLLLFHLFLVDLAQFGPAAKTLAFLGIGAFLLAASYLLPRALSRMSPPS